MTTQTPIDLLMVLMELFYYPIIAIPTIIGHHITFQIGNLVKTCIFASLFIISIVFALSCTINWIRGFYLKEKDNKGHIKLRLFANAVLIAWFIFLGYLSLSILTYILMLIFRHV